MALQPLSEAAAYLMESSTAGTLAQAAIPPPAGTVSRNMDLVANVPPATTATQSDLAFWGDLLIAGNYSGIRVIDISTPEAPVQLSYFPCNGGQGDVTVWGNLVFRSIDSPQNTPNCANSAGGSTGGVNAWEGIRIIDISDPSNPAFVGAVSTKCGSHTHTLVPDTANNRVLLYVSSYGPGTSATCLPPHQIISVVEVPLDAPQTASVISEPVVHPLTTTDSSGCHDITVYRHIDLAAGACMGEGQIWDISDPVNPVILSRIENANISFWHNAIFTYDGKYVAFGDELGGGVAARCRTVDTDVQGAVWFYNIENPAAPVLSGHFKLPRPQDGAGENCVSHNFNMLPRNDRYVMVHAWYQGGTEVIDWTNPASPREIAFMDFPPVTTPGGGGAWSSHWYNGYIYANDITRGIDVFKMRSSVPGQKLGISQARLNPQTQEPLFSVPTN
jgi:hypothetical protein